MTEADKSRWNQRYAAGDYDLTPNRRLVTRLAGRIHPGMTALDIACGAGRNSLWLAEQGVEVHGWDISNEALDRLQAEARRRSLEIHCREVDFDAEPLPEGAFDLVVDTHFLHRPLLLPMARALKPGGLLFLDIFMDSAKRSAVQPAYKVNPGEIARVYEGMMELLELTEDPKDGRAILLARRPT